MPAIRVLIHLPTAPLAAQFLVYDSNEAPGFWFGPGSSTGHCGHLRSKPVEENFLSLFFFYNMECSQICGSLLHRGLVNFLCIISLSLKINEHIYKKEMD